MERGVEATDILQSEIQTVKGRKFDSTFDHPKQLIQLMNTKGTLVVSCCCLFE